MFSTVAFLRSSVEERCNTTMTLHLMEDESASSPYSLFVRMKGTRIGDVFHCGVSLKRARGDSVLPSSEPARERLTAERARRGERAGEPRNFSSTLRRKTQDNLLRRANQQPTATANLSTIANTNHH